MILELPPFIDDDIHFLTYVDRVVRGVVAVHSPERFIVIRVDNWFGDKWLKFSGKALGAIGVRNQTNVVAPPSVPNRITAQSQFKQANADTYTYEGEGSQIHQSKPSSDNLTNRVRQVAPNTGLFWFSGNSKANARGSIMGVRALPGQILGLVRGISTELRVATFQTNQLP